MKKSICVFLLFVGIPFSIVSQTFDPNILKLAVSAYNENDYERAADYFTKYQKPINFESKYLKNDLETDSNLQYMFMFSYVKIQDWVNAKIQVENYYRYFKDTKSALYFQVRKDELHIDEMLLIEEEEYTKAINQKSLEVTNSYLHQFPYGKYRQILKDSVESFTEYLSWCNCAKYITFTICNKYLENYKNGKHIDSVMYVLSAIEERAFQIILKDKERELILNFMERYPQSKHYSEVRQIYKDLLFKRSLNNDIDRMLEYCELFPGDKQTFIVDSLIQVYYINKANTCFQARDYECAENYYNYYLEKYNNGFFKEIALSKAKKSKINTSLIGKKEYADFDHWFFMFNIDSDPTFGFTIGRLTDATISPFYNFRIRRISSSPEIIYDDGRNSSRYRYIVPAGTSFQEVLAYSMGIKYKPLNYPFWVYSTVGIGEYRNTRKYACYNQNLNGPVLDKYNYFTNGTPKIKGYCEAGFFVVVSKAISIKYGIMYNGKLNHQFGIGFIITKNSMQELGSCLNPANCCENPCSGISLLDLITFGFNKY